MIEEIIDTNSNSNDSGLIVNDLIQNELKKTIKWTMFLSILGFIGLGFMLIGALIMFGNMGRGFYGEQMFVMAITYMIMAIVYFFPVYFLYQFSSKMKSALEFGGQVSMNEAFIYMRKQYQFIGIVSIVVISIYILMFLSAIAFVGRY